MQGYDEIVSDIIRLAKEQKPEIGFWTRISFDRRQNKGPGLVSEYVRRIAAHDPDIPNSQKGDFVHGHRGVQTINSAKLYRDIRAFGLFTPETAVALIRDEYDQAKRLLLNTTKA
jgi:hypothetical protein